jgi:hypothetical protein
VNKIWIAIGVVGLIMMNASCDKSERTTLTPEEKELVDSLYSKQVPFARKQADSICDATYQVIFERAADSIKLTYIEEIKQILEGVR